MSPSLRRVLLLLLLYAKGPKGVAQPISGMTRLQKLLFLISMDQLASKHGGEGMAYEFVPYKFGPYSAAVRDNIEYLENLGLIAVKRAVERSPEGIIEDSHGIRDYAWSPGEDETESESFPNQEYGLTERGKRKIEEILTRGRVDTVDLVALLESVARWKTRFGSVPLKDLIRYVYLKYPKYATESIIRDEL